MLAWHAEPPLVAVNLFHLRGGRVVDRRDFYWEDLAEFEPGEFLLLAFEAALSGRGVPASLHSRAHGFEECEILAEVLSENAGHRVEIVAPQRGQKYAFLELVERNAKQSFLQRFRVLRPSPQAIAESLEAALVLPSNLVVRNAPY